jgi:4'-phosphopantetheinyl transferase
MTCHLIDLWEDTYPPQSTEDAQNFLRNVLAQYTKTSAERLTFAKSAFGKPYLNHFPQWQFNISHSGKKRLIAVSHHVPVGIDIELIKERRAICSLVNRCFAPSEQAYWFSLPKDQQLRAFYHLWTRKEAVVKGIGRGIALGLNQCIIDPQNPDIFLHLPVDEIWHTVEINIAPEYSVAIASLNQYVEICHKNL